jgi:NAD(P)-dependent dehydrogenase (short-subunit alcohol dehydrogenase family)
VGPPSEASQLLRRGLLEGVSVLIAGAPVASADRDDSLGGAVALACAELGARVSACPPAAEQASPAAEAAVDEEAVDAAVRAALGDAEALDLLVVDGAGLFERAAPPGSPAPAGARLALRTCLDATWNVTRAVFNLAFLPAQRGGRILYLAPSPGSGELADGARAGLENLARTLSIEWARHSVTALTIAPGDATNAGEVAALAAYLASPAGAYFSGCLIDLRGARAA